MTDAPSADVIAEALARMVGARPGAAVVDVGGGSGTRAVPLARAGCRVLVVDASTDALASLARRAADVGVSDRISAVQADADRLGADDVPDASADLVLYHHVVEEVDDPVRSLTSAVRVLRPAGRLSIVVPGRLSAVLAEALAGRYSVASAILAGDPAPDSSGYAGASAARCYETAALRALMERAGLAVESVTGVGVMTVLAGNRARGADDPALVRLENELGRHPVLGQLAADLHAVGIRPA
jgi:ubiquinone/menaquinone biosynthesis C-methylase UbiE